MGAMVLASTASAQLDLSKNQRAADGTVYEVIRVPASSLLAGVDQVRVTTVAGSVQSAVACTSPGGGAGSPTTSASGADANLPAFLHAYGETTRTGILLPNDETVSFMTGGAGRLTIGSGASAIDICRVASDCLGGASDTATFPLSSNQGGVPTACVATNIAKCSGQLAAYAFGILDAGNAPNCASSPTTATTQCASAPTDGFSLTGGQLVVFIYNHSLGMSGFSAGAGGFGVDNDASQLCSGSTGRVLTASALSNSAPPPPPTACGDGHVDTGEQCDDGNTNNSDGCTNACTTICGDDIKISPPEECDDGNVIDGDGCSSTCLVQGEQEPPPDKLAPAMGPLAGAISAAALLLFGRRALRRRH
jgi:cysteine-rich repeat protein